MLELTCDGISLDFFLFLWLASEQEEAHKCSVNIGDLSRENCAEVGLEGGT